LLIGVTKKDLTMSRRQELEMEKNGLKFWPQYLKREKKYFRGKGECKRERRLLKEEEDKKEKDKRKRRLLKENRRLDEQPINRRKELCNRNRKI
jgi:hypothetical protein